MKICKRILIILILFLSYIFTSLFFYSDAVTNNISKNVFRLHVIANSNSEEDQDLKYKVRDELIKYMKSISSNISTKDEALTLVNNNLDTFQAIASNVIIENGFDYPVKIEVGNFDFPTKTYGDISLPTGFYDALKVEIGEAQGRNWWCVMFPSLCFVDVSNGIVPEESKENLQSNLDYEDYNLISSDEAEYKIKFKLVEILENAKIIIANKST